MLLNAKNPQLVFFFLKKIILTFAIYSIYRNVHKYWSNKSKFGVDKNKSVRILRFYITTTIS